MKNENWIKWDLNSRAGIKMSAFFAEHGCEGYGFFVLMTENFYRIEGNKIPLNQCNVYAKACKVMQKDAKIYIDCLVELGLWYRDETHLWSPRVLTEGQLRSLKRLEVSEARKKAAEARWRRIIGEKNANGMQTNANECKGMQNMLDIDKEREREVDKNINIDINQEEKKPKKRVKEKKYTEFAAEDFDWGGHTLSDLEVLKEAVEKWITYKAKDGTPCLKDSYQQQIKTFSHRIDLYRRLVERAIEKGWKGLNEELPLGPKTESSSFFQPKRAQNAVNQERNLATATKMLKEIEEGKTL